MTKMPPLENDFLVHRGKVTEIKLTEPFQVIFCDGNMRTNRIFEFDEFSDALSVALYYKDRVPVTILSMLWNMTDKEPEYRALWKHGFRIFPEHWPAEHYGDQSEALFRWKGGLSIDDYLAHYREAIESYRKNPTHDAKEKLKQAEYTLVAASAESSIELRKRGRYTPSRLIFERAHLVAHDR